MGLFSKIFGGEDAAATSTAFSRDAVREPVDRLIAALDALTSWSATPASRRTTSSRSSRQSGPSTGASRPNPSSTYTT